ncbi:MAG: O-antigen ligase family protein [Chryseolinea sp.]
MNSQLTFERRSWASNIDQFRFSLLILLAVMIPFDVGFVFIVLPTLSIVLLFVSDNFNIRSTIVHVTRLGFLMTLLFFVHGVWFLKWVAEQSSAGYVEKMLPMFLFPLMIFSTRITHERFLVIAKSFIWTVITSYMLSLMAAVYHYFFSVARWGRPSDFFFHEQFTAGLFNIHPTYYALFGCLATLLAFSVFSVRLRILTILLLTVGILLINARITFIVQMVVIGYNMIKGFSSGFSFLKFILVLLMAIALFLTLRFFNSIYDYPHRKLLVNLDTAWERSYAGDISDGDGGIVLRMAIWRSSVKLFQDHPVFGIGLGYEEDFLVEEYKAKNQPHLYQSHFNAHNQLLSYLIGMGALGCLALGCVYGIFVRDAVLNRKWYYFEFLTIFLIVGLTESVLNRLLGVAMFSFFHALMIKKFDPKK